MNIYGFAWNLTITGPVSRPGGLGVTLYLFVLFLFEEKVYSMYMIDAEHPLDARSSTVVVFWLMIIDAQMLPGSLQVVALPG